ncbi:MAG: CotH kinase family protein [Myxococcota bacterium]
MLAHLIACGKVMDYGGEPVSPQAEDDDAARAEGYEALFAPDRVHEVRLRVAPSDLAALDADPLTYVPADFEHEGDVVERVGLRLKGSSSFQTFDGKPAFRIRFDEFEEGVEYAWMERLSLNNMVNDAAMGREIVAYAAWNEAGMSAPRAAFAEVWVNDERFGLYAMVEPYDGHYLDRRYAASDGDLWEANDSADLTAEGIAHFDLACGGGEGLQLGDAALALRDAGEDFYADADEVLVMDQFLDYWAWAMATGNLDGYPYNLNDYFLYGNPDEGGRFEFSPWGLDETWDTGWAWQWGQGAAGFGCAADYECNQLLRERTEEALAAYEEMDVPRMAEAFFLLSEEAMQRDPRMPWTPAEALAKRDALVARMEAWPDRVRTSMAAGP